MAAFSAVLAAFVATLAWQVAALRRMEERFAAMSEREEQVFLALRLEAAERDQYEQHARLITGDSARLAEYESARARARELVHTLSERIREPHAIAWVEQVRDASAELDRLLRDEVAQVARGRDASAALAQERSYQLVSVIEQSADNLVGRLQLANSSFRADLVALERAALRWTVLLLVGAPLLVAAVMLYLSHSVARPLARLGQGAAALARGDLDTRIDIESADEFGALAADFNAMTVALREHQKRLVESERLAGIGTLAAGIAHELNNPLQVVLGYLSLNRDVADPRLAGQLAAAEAETLRCKDIVAGLLDLSHPAPRLVPVDLRALCEDVAHSLAVAVQPLALRLRVEGRAVTMGDGPRLRQILFNLLKNAVEAAGPAGEVAVVLGTSARGVEVTVRDSGPGISPQARARLFEPFFTTKPTGTGLGLAVSRAIALAHGGDIDLENSATQGATVTLRLPCAAEAGAPS